MYVDIVVEWYILLILARNWTIFDTYLLQFCLELLRIGPNWTQLDIIIHSNR